MKAPLEQASPGMGHKVRLIHLIGIGGIGMSGIAEVLLNLGYQVRGSDLRSSETTERLAQLGGDIRKGHEAENVAGADVVVISSAVPQDNPEIVAARKAKIPIIRRAEMLAELMRFKHGIAIAGTHGKTTTTSMVGALLSHAGLDPTIVVGGKVNTLGTTAKLGQGPYLVAEADESDGSFLHLSPTIAAVTNIDAEHLDHYQGGMEEIRQVFSQFLGRLPFYGLAVLCVDHPEVQAMLPQLDRRVKTYGFSPQADFKASKLRFEGQTTHFSVNHLGEDLGEFQLSMLGKHNIENALASIAIAHELGVSFEIIKEGLKLFSGVDRRFSIRGVERGVMVVDDYGHHPAELVATLEGARAGYPDRRCVAVFQPHRYSRTEAFMADFARAFNLADIVYLLPIYAAGEAPREGVSQKALQRALEEHGHRQVYLLDSVDRAPAQLSSKLRENDLVIAFGAGDVGRFGRALLKSLAG